MDNKKFCFISCVNNKQYYNECLYYISKLNIPEGYTVEMLSIEDATSMTSGYNKAMKMTDAKYKIYLHQDTFILDEDILYVILDIFKDTNVGMIGAVGSKTISTEGYWWNTENIYGNYYDNVQLEMKKTKSLEESKEEYIELKAIDGFIMITQYDVPWREDIFDNWHYYDYSESIEFLKAGYKVVTPNIDKTWVMHDCGLVNSDLMDAYYKYNKVFIEEYGDYLFPLVSILIPSYNRPDLFKIALESAINQTYKNIEIVICDDSTNNEIEDLMKVYLNKYNNIRYYHNEKRLGQFDNDLKLMKLAKGKYINFLMDDDVFEPNKVKKMMDIFLDDIKGDVGIVTSNRKVIDRYGNYKGNFISNDVVNKFANKKVNGKELMEFIMLHFYNIIGEPTTALFNKEKMSENFGYFNNRRYICNVEEATWMNILINSSIVILDECLSSFRILDNQQSNNKEMIIGGAKDYTYMLLDSKKFGLFTNNQIYYRALINCKKYVYGEVKKGNYDSELLKMQEKLLETEKKYNNFMDEGKRDILFVILSDNKQYYRECVRYINDLYVPSGYNLKIIDYIQLDEDIKNKNKLDVFSAKYKVYLQDTTFIINRNFIYDVLNIFKDDSIGMIGICGTNKQVDNYKNIEWNCGKYIFYNGKNTVKRTSITDSNEEYTYVNKVDDKLLITQYDFDFYNEYKDDNFVKSTKMFQRGYKIVVPNKKIWCFCEEKIEVSDDNKIIIENLVQKGDINLIEKLYNKLNLSDLNNRYFNEVINILEAFLIEIKKDKECDKKLFKGLELKKLIKHYNYLKFLLRRIQYNFNDERISDFEIDIKKRKISFNLVYKIMVTSLISNENAYQVLYNGYSNTKEKPLISVIIPTYNSSCLLRDTIDSILNQTYENIEVIVIDDGSTDSTKEILQSYTDKRIKSIFLEKNMNVCNAGNIGFKQAKGKYIALVGHDDIWKEDKLQKQILFMEYNINYGLCFTWANIINENKKIVNEKNNELYNLFCSRNYSSSYCLYKLLSQGNFLCAPSVLIRSEMLKKVGYYHYGFVQLQDYDLWIRFLMNSYYMYIMPEKLTYYRWFDDKNKNLSGLNQRKRIRIYNETSLIIDYSIWNMDKSIFIKTFFDNLTGIDKLNDKDIICKKVMLLLKMNNKYVIKRLAEVLEDDECRKILEESYNFTLKDFYELNTKII